MTSAYLRRIQPVVLIAVLATLVLSTAPPAVARTGPESGTQPAESEWFPPTKAGWPGAWLDPRNSAPYLAFHQTAAKQAKSALREEPTSNQALYDARYYALDLSLNPTTRILTGVVTMWLTVTGGPLTQVDLDLADNMVVSSLTSAGIPVTFTHTGGILRVNLDRTYANDENATLVIQYAGNPAGDAFGWDTAESQLMIWTLSEAFGARDWWPCKDYPDDKADSVDVRVTVPTGLITVSNGNLRQQSDNGTQAFSWWHESHPITTYLVSLAIHTYHVYSDWYVPAFGDSMAITFYNYQSSIPGVEPVQAKVKNMMAIFAARFGEYPFLDEKYGHAEFPWGGGMEHQTVTSLGYFGEGVVAHELAHQWWGDMVTCANFHDVWLNEGLATYCEAIYREGLDGPDAYLDEMLAAQYLGAGTIYVPDTNDWNRIFDSNLSYNKASWVPHMLRGIMGDSTFFAAMGEFRNRFAYRSATTGDFRATMEDISGRDLGAFFQQWIYGEYYPIYHYGWTAAPAGGGWDVTLTVNQLQSWQLFTMPIQVVVTTATGERTFQVEDALASQVFTLHTDAQPTEVALDPSHWILRQVLAPLPTPTFDRQLLLVNGVDWATYGTEITTAYQDRSFTGGYPVDFWDVFAAPSGGYPTSLPAPLGHGTLTPEVMAHYKTVVWVGNNYNGDLASWMDSPVYSYLQAGGNLLLLTRQGSLFLSGPLQTYLGISFLSTGTIYDCIATYPGLTNISRLGTQDQVSGFSTTVGSETTLLYKAVSGHTPNWGIGAIRIPPAGGTYNPQGGRLAFLSGRAYRWNHANLKTNCEFILGNLLGLPLVTGSQTVGIPARLSLRPASPNPFSTETELRFVLPTAAQAQIEVFDLAGRRVRTLPEQPILFPAGEHRLPWDGLDESRRPVSSGVYFLRLQAGGQTREERVLRVR
jgi:hypothetical protein